MTCFLYENLSNAPTLVKNDFVLVLSAVRHNGLNLEHASNALRDNHDIVLSAVIQNGDAINFASDRLKNDPSVRTWVRSNGMTGRDNLFYSESPETKSDDEDEISLNLSCF
ncbi:MAG: DUF4116 domain-containing protein [Gammaproteobacteria bacterium]|nr:DUF4116 domain-containing protein [Gammaproteobacteria bacterium]MCH9717608.1 DUF4116 domain-containing protein [Gammaproteobacteria bacterium]MCH9762629.1 DUF4116 domain-containing protein [Gammaproteobacteria bacterium]